MKLSIIKFTLFSLILTKALLLDKPQFFDMTNEAIYSNETGYGYDFNTKPQSESNKNPAYFSIKVDDGNYKVTIEIGSNEFDANTTVRAENRRLLIHNLITKKGEFKKFTFVLHKRSPSISNGKKVRLKPRELSYLSWDDRLTFEFNGNAPAVRSLNIEPDNNAITLFLCGDSTVVEASGEPWASWGQMITKWFDENICIANHAESGLTTTTFMSQNRLEKVLDMAKPGDYIFVEFGHNDEKDKGSNAGAFLNYAENLKTFITKSKNKGLNPIILSPTARRQFDGDKIKNTHGDYPEAARQVAEKEGVPFIDLTQLTTDLYEAYGDTISTKLFVHYPAGVYSETELKDNTHFNPFGAYEVAKCVIFGLKHIDIPFIIHLREEWKDFDPKNPDNWEDFIWVPAPSVDSIKPDGD